MWGENEHSQTFWENWKVEEMLIESLFALNNNFFGYKCEINLTDNLLVQLNWERGSTHFQFVFGCFTIITRQHLDWKKEDGISRRKWNLHEELIAFSPISWDTNYWRDSWPKRPLFFPLEKATPFQSEVIMDEFVYQFQVTSTWHTELWLSRSELYVLNWLWHGSNHILRFLIE